MGVLGVTVRWHHSRREGRTEKTWKQTRKLRNLQMLREGLGLSVRAVSKEAGVSAATISRAERGYDTETKTLIKLARFYRLHTIADQMEWLIS